MQVSFTVQASRVGSLHRALLPVFSNTDVQPFCHNEVPFGLAGVCLNGTLESTSVSDFVEQMNVNFIGAVTMTKGRFWVLTWTQILVQIFCTMKDQHSMWGAILLGLS